MNVKLDIDHAWDADLDVFLIGPGGIEVELFTDVGGDLDNFSSTAIDDEASAFITSSSAPFTGVFQPEGQLSDFNGGSTSGTWTLRIEDDTKGIVGTLTSWSLTITYATPPPVAGISVTPTSGLVTGEDGTNASFDVVLDTQPTADVTIGISSDDTDEGTVLPTSLVFTSTNWDQVQTVTVTGVDDLADPKLGDDAYSIVTAAAVSADASYNGLDPDDVSVTNLDNETPAGVAVTDIDPNMMFKGETIPDVKINGSGFVAGASVTFIGGSGRAPTASNLVVTGGRITATVSAHRKAKSSTWDVVVTNPDGSTGTCDGCFGVGVVPATAPANQQFAMAAPLNEPTASSDTEPQRRSRRGARDEVFSRLDRTERAQRRARRAANTPLRRLQAVAVDRAMTDPAGHSRIARRGRR